MPRYPDGAGRDLPTIARHLAIALATGACTLGAHAADPSWSGFGSIGYARTNQNYAYERHVTDAGTWRRDTLLGLQLESDLTPGLSATMQAVVAPGVRDSRDWQARLQWLFLSWRNSNDALMRVGKLRIPLYLHSQNMQVGASYDYQLPAEMYAMTPTSDMVGLAVTRSWTAGSGELSADAYLGEASSTFRNWVSTPVPGLLPGGTRYLDINTRAGGLVLAWRGEGLTLRASAHQTETRNADGTAWTVNYPWVGLPGGLGYYRVDHALPGPASQFVPRFDIRFYTLGAEASLSPRYRVVAEYAQREVQRIVNGYGGSSAYVTVLRSAGPLSTYVTYATLRSNARARALYNALVHIDLPASVPQAALINAAQQAGADYLVVSDQRAWTLGATWSLSPTARLKAELKRVHIGDASALADRPAGVNLAGDSVRLLSLSYHFTF